MRLRIDIGGAKTAVRVAERAVAGAGGRGAIDPVGACMPGLVASAE